MKKTTKLFIIALSLAILLAVSVIGVLASDGSSQAIKVVSKDSSETLYSSDVAFSEVIAAAADGDTIIAYKDIDVNQTVYIDKSLTIDLGGNSITTTGYIIP